MVQGREPAETSLLRQAESSGHLTIQTEYKKIAVDSSAEVLTEAEALAESEVSTEDDDFGVL